MNLREAAQQALEALENDPVLENANNNAMAWLRAALADTQDWDEIKALRASLREHMAEIKRLNECLTWEQHRAEHVSTHGPGCAMWGPRHYECLLQAHKALKERTDRSADTGKTSDHIADASKMMASVREDRTDDPVTDCHKKEGDKLAFPLSTLAVHVGYRYQSPVGDWEYGDHIPAGFDTDKWAHQKIYILQEQ